MKNVIFDFDGTLADSRQLVIKAMRAGFAQANLPEPDDATTLSIMGIPLEIGVHQITPASCTQEDYDAIIAGFRNFYLSHHDQLELYPNVKETLAQLVASGHDLFIASSKSRPALQEELTALGIIDYFKYILSADDVKFAKPAPDAVVSLVKTFKLDPAATVMVGDATFDLEMGKGAGVFTCAVEWGAQDHEQLSEVGPDAIASEFAQLADIDKMIANPPVTIRLLQADDAERLYQLIKTNRQYLGKWFRWVEQIDSLAAERLVVENKLTNRADGNLNFAIMLEDELVGVISLHHIDLLNNSATVKFWLASGYSKRGVMEKAVPQVVAYAFSTLSLNTLRVTVDTANTAAMRVVTRNGFSQDGKLVAWKKKADGYHDFWLYSKKTFCTPKH